MGNIQFGSLFSNVWRSGTSPVCTYQHLTWLGYQLVRLFNCEGSVETLVRQAKLA